MNIIEKIKSAQDIEKEIFYYFNSKSKLFNAIRRHIYDENDENVLIPGQDGYKVAFDRAHGPMVSFKETLVYATQYRGNTPYEVDFFEIQFRVEWFNVDDDDDKEINYRLHVPIDLELNFTEEKFNQWIAEKKKEKLLKEEKKDKEILKTLLKKYPDFVS